MNYCKVIIGGRIAKDLELKATNSGTSVLAFPVAVARICKDKNATTDFFTCVAWSQTAELIKKYFRKGSNILIDGELQTRAYTDREGKTRKVVEVVVSDFAFVDPPTAELTEPDPEPEDDGDEKLPF